MKEAGGGQIGGVRGAAEIGVRKSHPPGWLCPPPAGAQRGRVSFCTRGGKVLLRVIIPLVMTRFFGGRVRRGCQQLPEDPFTPTQQGALAPGDVTTLERTRELGPGHACGQLRAWSAGPRRSRHGFFPPPPANFFFFLLRQPLVDLTKCKDVVSL